MAMGPVQVFLLGILLLLIGLLLPVLIVCFAVLLLLLVYSLMQVLHPQHLDLQRGRRLRETWNSDRYQPLS